MNAKSKPSAAAWVDPDDAPELSEEFFEKAEWTIGDKVVSREEGAAALVAAVKRGRRRAALTKQPVTIRLDPDVVDAFKATGRGWQTRMNAVLKAWLQEHDELAA